MLRTPFALERTYRESFAPELLDLSSSAPASPLLSQLVSSKDLDMLGSRSLGYETSGGSSQLRRAIASLYPGLDAENILVTAGAVEAIRAAAMALVEPGQRVLVQKPTYQALAENVRDAGGHVVILPPKDSDLNFEIPRSLHQNDGPQLAFLNSPHGPGGTVVRGLEGLIGRTVVDEVYRPISLTPGILQSCVQYIPHSVAIGDLSKPLGLGGLRVGWLASRDLDVIDKCAQALDYLSGSISTLSAAVAVQALGRFDELLESNLILARRNLTQLTRFVEQHRDLFTWAPPQAGYTACLRLLGGPPPPRFFASLRRRGVFLLKGEAIGLPDCLRIGLGLPEDSFSRALDLLGAELQDLNPRQDESLPERDVILYTKLPRVGHGKSRLAAGIGAEQTAKLAHAFLQDSLDLAKRESRRLFVAVAPSDALPEFALALPDALVYRQSGEGMGERLASAFEGAFARGATLPVLIGSDSPTLPGHLLSVASRALQCHDIVLGPALDGGYYAIGLSKPVPSLFEGIDWNSERVLAQTVERAERAGLSVFYLPPWYDVDTRDDLELLRRDVRPGTATSAALRAVT
jgi:rSAM/selenodomain-associated transferase 1